MNASHGNNRVGAVTQTLEAAKCKHANPKTVRSVYLDPVANVRNLEYELLFVAIPLLSIIQHVEARGGCSLRSSDDGPKSPKHVRRQLKSLHGLDDRIDGIHVSCVDIAP